jgi:hypothetical protein
MKKLSVIAATLLGAAVLCAAPISLHNGSLSVDKARAIIGRPLTPGSIAGVHRRAYRRGYYGHGYGYYGYAHRPYGYYGYARPYGYYGYAHRPLYYGYGRLYGDYGYRRPYVGGYYGHQRRVARRVYRRHNY